MLESCNITWPVFKHGEGVGEGVGVGHGVGDDVGDGVGVVVPAKDHIDNRNIEN